MIRLDKCLANLGYGSRKDVKKIIRRGDVRINDIPCLKEDTKFDEERDKLSVFDEEVKYTKYVYIMLNKLQDVVSATTDTLHATVLNCIEDKQTGLFPVGRLDIDTEGLCLITNDGQLAHELLSPKKHVAKKYYVEYTQALTIEHYDMMKKGIVIDGDELCKPAVLEIINEHACYLTIVEGKYHQIKRMLKACDSEVTYLKRLTMGTLVLDENLELGQWRYLSEAEIEKMKN